MDDLTAQLRQVCLSGQDNPDISIDYLNFLFESLTGGARMAEDTTREQLINTLCMMYGYGEGIPPEFGPELPPNYELPVPRSRYGPSRVGIASSFVYPGREEKDGFDDEDYDDEDTDDEREDIVMNIMNDNDDVADIVGGDEVQDLPRQAIILYLRLNNQHDPTGALHRQDDLLGQLTTACEGYTLMEIVVNNYDQMMRELRAIHRVSVTSVIVLTHGDVHSIQVGAHASLHDDTPQFTDFARELSRVMMPNASVILTACLVGNYHGADRNTQYSLVSVENDPTASCFANSLAANISINSPVYATTRVQVADELELFARNEANEPTACDVNNDRPMSYGVLSSRQTMQVFTYDGRPHPERMNVM
jgi:hypothetical protein